MRCFFLVLICLHFTSVLPSVNYCGSKMCGNSDIHTFCQYSNKPGPQCVGFVSAPLSKQEKNNIVSRMNQRRNDVALGMLNHLPSAADMIAVRWVDELAREAQLWANQCSPPEFPGQHDICRDLSFVSTIIDSIPVGQNVASVVGEAPGLRVETMIDLWYMQGRHYKGQVTSYMPPPYNQSYYGDFAQMVWSPTFMVGCARTKFQSVWLGRGRSVARLVCNLAPRGPRAARSMWTPGPPVSRCPPRTRPSNEYPGLCAPYDIQRFDDKKNKTSLKYTILLSTLAELDKNSSLDYVGRLDEIYLTKLAALTMEQSKKGSKENRSKTLEEITSRLGVKLNDNNNTINKQIARERRKIRRYLGKRKRKIKLIGRPKPYYLYELIKEEDKKITKNTDYIKPTMTIDKINENLQTVKHDDGKKDVSLLTTTITSRVANKTSTKIEANVRDFEKHPTTLNYITEEEDDSEITDEIIQDYLNNPETARQIQETLLRAEQALSSGNFSSDSTGSSSPNSKSDPESSTKSLVRRELRITDEEDFEKFKQNLKKVLKDPKKDEDDPLSKVLEKGTMMKSLMDTLPSLRAFGYASGSKLNPNATSTIILLFLLLLFSICTVF